MQFDVSPAARWKPTAIRVEVRRGNGSTRLRWIAGLVVCMGLYGCRDADKSPSELERQQKFWNETYREPRTFPPSAFLIEMVEHLKPGRALDIAMGQGRNSLYLASRGWRVTGIDISDEGIRQARAAAASRKLTIETLLKDVDTWDHGRAQWDLVLLIYAGDDMAKVRRSLKPGGLVVSERFHSDANPRIGTTPAEFAKRYGEGFDILRNEVVSEVSVWGNRHHDPTKVVHFAARKRAQ